VSAIRAVAYYRMSTDRQEASIPEQRAWAERAAPQNRLTLVRACDDPGIPAARSSSGPA